MSIAVFLGPSLSRGEAEAILDADYRPPVRQGDIYRLVEQGKPQAIAVIDGYFQEVPSVWHKEILWALDQGIPVFGAASMGALRAAELDRFGMVGVGKIYEAYRTGRYTPYDDELFEDDDEVAVIHGPAELSFPALSDAMVDLRETLAAAAAAGVIEGAERDALIGAFKRRFYRERSFEALPEVLVEVGMAPPRGDALLAWLREGRIAQKRADAMALLRLLAEDGLDVPVSGDAFVFERTTLWAQFVEQSAASPTVGSAAERAALEELRLDPDLYAVVRDAAILRLRLGATDPVPSVDDSQRRAALDRLRRRHGLWTREALDTWAADCDLDRAGLDRLLDFDATLESCARAIGPALDPALLDVLRRDGRYQTLAARARDKRECLGAAKGKGSATSALSPAVLLDWYFERCLERTVPSNLEGYAAEVGFEGVEALLSALAREYAYRAQREGPSAPQGA